MVKERRCWRCNVVIDDCDECRHPEDRAHGCRNGNWHVYVPDPRDIERDAICLCNWCHKEYEEFIYANCRRWMNMFTEGK
jgi:hypothetical protein